MRCYLLLLLNIISLPLWGADYYWIGGNGSWTDLSHWSTSSGGVANQLQVPTANDNVYFTAASFSAPNQTLSLPATGIVCRNLDFSGINQALIITGSGNIQCYGSFLLHPLIQLQWVGNLELLGSAPGLQIRTGTVRLPQNLTIQGNGTWSLLDSLVVTDYFYHRQGSFNAGGHLLRLGIFESYDTLNRVLDFGSSSIHIMQGGYIGFILRMRNLQLNAAHATIHFYTSAWLGCNDGISQVVFHRVIGYDDVRIGNIYDANVDFALMTPSMRFSRVEFRKSGGLSGNLFIDSLHFSAGFTYAISGNDTIGSSFVANGNCTAPIEINSGHPSIAGHLHKTGGAVNLNYTNLLNLHTHGGATFTANNCIDRGGNAGWNIGALLARTLYWVGNSGNWSDGSHWALSSGGAGSGCPPSAIDSVVFDQNSFTANNQTVTAVGSEIRCSGMSWNNIPAGRLPVFSSSAQFYNAASLILHPQVQWQQSGWTILQGNGTHFLRTFQKTIQNYMEINGNGDYYLLDSLRLDGTLTLNKGGLHTQNHVMRLWSMNSNSGDLRRLNLGSSRLYITSDHAEVFLGGTNLSLNPGSSLLELTGLHPGIGTNWSTGLLRFGRVLHSNAAGTAQIFAFDTLSFHRLELRGNANFTYRPGQVPLGRQSFDTLILSSGKVYRFQENTRYHLGDSVHLFGGCTGPIQIESAAPGLAFELVKHGAPVYGDNLILRDAHATGTATFYAGNSNIQGNSPGWTSTAAAPRTVYWRGNGGFWNDPSHWSLSSGGPGGACVPRAIDTVIINAASFTLPSQQLIINSNAQCYNFRVMPGTNNFTLAGTADCYVSGSFQLQPAVQLSWSGRLYLNSNDTGQVISTANKTFHNHLSFTGTGSWRLSDSLKTTGNILHERGSLFTQNNIIQTQSWLSQSQESRSLQLGSSELLLQGNPARFAVDTTAWQFAADNSHFRFQGSNNSLSGAANTSFHRVSFETSGSNDTITRSNGANFHRLSFAGNARILDNQQCDSLMLSPGGEYTFSAGDTLTIQALFYARGINCLPIRVNSTLAGQATFLHRPSDTVSCEFVQFRDFHATGAALFYAGGLSTNLGNTTGWLFQAKPGTLYGFESDTLSLCLGDSVSTANFIGALSYLWSNGQTTPYLLPSTPGLYTVNLVYGPSCSTTDSIFVQFFPRPTPVAGSNSPLCSGDTLRLQADSIAGAQYLWTGPNSFSSTDRNPILPNATVAQNGNYIVRRITIDGCTTNADTVAVFVGGPSRDTLRYTRCFGDTLFRPGGAAATLSGTYTDSLLSFSGCDSILVTELQVLAVATFNQNISICQGDTFVRPGGSLATTPGTFVDTLINQSAQGCDSIISTQLQVLSIGFLTDTAQICANSQYLLPNGLWVNTAGRYRDTLTAAATNGCDSIFDLLLRVEALATSMQTVNLCPGDSYTLPGGTIAQAAGVFNDTLTAAAVNGCDSIVRTTIQMLSIGILQNVVSICSGDQYQLPSGIFVSAAGTYEDTLTGAAANGCDSIFRTIVQVLPLSQSAENIILCPGESYQLPGGQLVTTAGNYTDTLQNFVGCDSIIDFTIDFEPLLSAPESIDTLLCAAGNFDFYYPYLFLGSIEWYADTTAPAIQTGNSIRIRRFQDSIHYYIAERSPIGCLSPFSRVVLRNSSTVDIYFPNAFTPNGDGTNDVWTAKGNFFQPQLLVYNRWGNLVKEGFGADAVWDGGNEPAGNYGYVFVYRNCSDQTFQQTGKIVLIR